MKISIGQFKALVREAAQETDNKEMLIGVYSDIYKEKNGIRPRWMMDKLRAMSDDEIEAELNKLQDQRGMDDEDYLPVAQEFPDPESTVTSDELMGVDSMENLPSAEPMGMDHRPETRWHGPNIRKK